MSCVVLEAVISFSVDHLCTLLTVDSAVFRVSQHPQLPGTAVVAGAAGDSWKFILRKFSVEIAYSFCDQLV